METIKYTPCDYNCFRCIFPCTKRDKSVNYDNLIKNIEDGNI